MEKFKTLRGWIAHLKRDKEEEYKDWKKRNGIQDMPAASVINTELPEGELRV